MNDLIAWLGARYDEAEATAKAAAARLRVRNPEPWYEADDGRFAYPEDAAFIAANDPAHRLRDIALKRAILAEHASSGGMYPTCMRCARWEPGTWYGDEKDGEEPPDDMSSVSYPCRTVRQLGTEFSDHPEYRKEWGP